MASCLIAGACSAMLLFAVLRYRAQRGVRTVRCPETDASAEVEVDALLAATDFSGEALLHVKRCSLWHERASCSEACLMPQKALVPSSNAPRY